MTTHTISSVPEDMLDLALTRISEGNYRVIKCGEAAAVYLMRDGEQKEFRALKRNEILEIPRHVNRFWNAISDCVVKRVEA